MIYGWLFNFPTKTCKTQCWANACNACTFSHKWIPVFMWSFNVLTFRINNCNTDRVSFLWPPSCLFQCIHIWQQFQSYPPWASPKPWGHFYGKLPCVCVRRRKCVHVCFSVCRGTCILKLLLYFQQTLQCWLQPEMNLNSIVVQPVKTMSKKMCLQKKRM